MKDGEWRCKTCKYREDAPDWYESEAVYMSWCERERDGDAKFSTAGEGCGATLEVADDFGCVHWEQVS